MLILSIFLIILYAIILFFIYLGLQSSKTRLTDALENPTVSIIIAVKNETENIITCLESLINQKYPKEKTQILVIDDQSTDDTYTRVKSYSLKHKNITCLQSDNPSGWNSSKKAALEAGYKYATGELLLYTDADCQPPVGWIQGLANCFKPQTGLVAGFSPQTCTLKKQWNRFLFVDSLSAAIVAATTILMQNGATCTGRNLAIRKQTLDEIGGYTTLPDTLSGDDDFILQAINKHPSWQTSYSFNPATHIPAKGPGTWQQFLKQKSRHLSSGTEYRFNQQLGYGLYHLSNACIWILFLWSLASLNFTQSFLLSTKLLLDFSLLSYFGKKMDIQLPLSGFFIWEVLFPLYHLLSGPAAFIKKISWK